MTSENKPRKSFGESVGSFFKIVLRIIFTTILAIGLGVGLYYGIVYGIPALQNQYIQPVRDNTQRLDNLEARQAQQIEQLTEQLGKLQDRLEGLEMQNDTDKEAFADLQTQIASLSNEVSSAQKIYQTNQEQVDGQIESLQEDLKTVNTDLETQYAQTQEAIEGLAAAQVPITDLHNELTTVKAMELLTRAQQSLLHNNYGLAQNDLLASQELLFQLQSEVSDAAQIDHLSTIIQHLETASGQLPDSPSLASKELEIAWELLISGAEETGDAGEADTDG